AASPHCRRLELPTDRRPSKTPADPSARRDNSSIVRSSRAPAAAAIRRQAVGLFGTDGVLELDAGRSPALTFDCQALIDTGIGLHQHNSHRLTHGMGQMMLGGAAHGNRDAVFVRIS